MTARRYVYPRGICPRCGQAHALIKDLSRTIVHACHGRSDEVGEFNRGNPFMIAVELGTGAIVRDPFGEVKSVRAAIFAVRLAHAAGDCVCDDAAETNAIECVCGFACAPRHTYVEAMAEWQLHVAERIAAAAVT